MQFKESFIFNRSASDDPSAYSKVSSGMIRSNDCCPWDGVESDENTGHVISLDLSSSYLYGSINSSNSLFQLVHFQIGTELFLDLGAVVLPRFSKKNFVYIYNILFLAICINKIALFPLNNIIDIFKCYKKNISPPIKIKPKQHTKKKKNQSRF